MAETQRRTRNGPKEDDRAGNGSQGAPTGGLARLAAALRNGMEIARFGSLGEREPSPFEVVAEAAHHRLRRYFPDARGEDSVPVLLVPPIMMTAEIWDVAPGSSAVSALHEAGADPWVVDFGSPEKEEGGLERTLTDHVVGVSGAIEAVREATGQPVHLMGYSQGGMFAYQAAAYRRSDGIASLVTFGSGVDLHLGLPSSLPTELVIDSIERFGKLQEALMPGGIPSWATRLGFQLMDPIKTVQQRVDFARRLYDREALQKREGMRRFMEVEGWTAFPGPALTDLLKQLVAQNRLLQGGLVIDGQAVTLADITCPIMAFVGLSDSIAPPQTVRAIYAAAPQADCYQVKVPTGHFGLVVGSQSNEITWPVVAEWLAWCRDRGPLPKAATLLVESPVEQQPGTPIDDLLAAAALAWDLGVNVASTAAQGIGDRIGILGRLARIVAPQLPRLSRLAEIRSGTQVSPGRSLRERAEASPDDTFFLFEGRAHSYQAADVRIDNIVRGLLECGVRHGQHVGLLMETRPSAVAAAVALSRLGAVAVMLRPDVPLSKQLEVVRVEHLLCDPERAEAAHPVFGRDVLVLGGGGEARTLAPGLVDMEAIDPDAVELPDWYTPNPGLAGELALVLITGGGEQLGTSRVTNRRWATSAYGTASGCALTPHHTVYCCSPTHHPTGILVCVGGALVSGARLAMASEFTSSVDPKIFWQDVRRYGVNVVFYTGALCRVLVNAPESQQERHHSIRLLAGSGMPKGLWPRVVDRFAPATVVEFFASTEGNAVLVNLTGEKVGSLGRPLPGGGELAIAAWDLERGQLTELPSGFAGHCKPGEIGLLVERVDRERGEVEGRPLRGVFEAGDAWLSTRDLVRIDEDGDYWLVDYIADVIQTANGPIATIAVEDVLTSELECVDLAAVYGVRLPDCKSEIPVAALALRPGTKLDPLALRSALREGLPRHLRPIVIRVVDDLPMTAGHRTRKRTLRSEGLGLENEGGESLWLAPGQEGYVPLSSDDLGRLLESLAT
ncbi:MAG: alpha/beta fold hydrolase [Deltaproteobacteria bacterium]|nr:alpha/beta fold hydrolase [Deltaproteobacteria bacterium]